MGADIYNRPRLTYKEVDRILAEITHVVAISIMTHQEDF